MQESLDARKITECLNRLGDVLVEVGVQSVVRILVIGGAFMITQIYNRSMTTDIDVLINLDRSTEDYEKLLEAASRVAAEKHVDERWFSDGIGDLMMAVAVDLVPGGKLWLKHGLLEVYMPDPCYVLALKLLAGGRDKDIRDVQILLPMCRIRNRKHAERLLKRYFSKRALEVFADDIQKSFNVFLPEG